MVTVPLCKGGYRVHYARVAYLALSKGGYRVHYARVTTIQGWIWGPLCKGGHYPWEHYPRVAIIQESVEWQLLSKAFRGSTIQGWPLSKSQLNGNYCQKPSWDHYPRVATIQESVEWQLLSKALLGSTIQGWPLSKSQLSGNYCQKPFLGALSEGSHYPRVS